MKFLGAIAAVSSVAAASAVAPGVPLDTRGGFTYPDLTKRWEPDFGDLPPLPHPNAASPERVAPGPKQLVKSEQLQKNIKSRKLLDHAENLEAIAYATTQRNRVFGSPGHNFTALYLYQLIDQLKDYYTVQYQPFVELYSGGDAKFTVDGVEQGAELMSFAPNGQVDGELFAVANLGCDAADYAGTAGKIALISRGTCTFGSKATLAGAADAIGAVIYNNVNGSLSGTLGGAGDYPPTAAIGLTEGQALAARAREGVVTGFLDVNSILENRTTINVIAQTKNGDPNNVIMVGAHADSVDAGPGINDNGSGSIGILEVALNLAKYRTNNAVRFAWWSAEEFGLLGSEYYVRTLPKEEQDKIRLYLNFDMIASPNYFYGIYDGDGSGFNISGPPGSAEAEKLFEDYFKEKYIPSQPTEFSGRSDYGPFLEVGIAAGGLFTGAEVIKTPEEAIKYGGEAGVAYDVNYHKAGDNVANLNLDAFLVNSKAIAHAVATYATSFASLPPKAPRVVKRAPTKKAKKTGCNHKPTVVVSI